MPAIDVRRHIGPLDGLRALASLSVVATHVGFVTGVVQPDLIGSMVARLDVGVPIFFALSGFLLARPWLAVALGVSEREPRIGSYLIRRFARIVPAYWSVLLVVFLIASNGWSRRQFTSGLELTTSSALTHVLVGQGYSGGYFANFTQTWSLTTEIGFYLVLPIAGVLLVRSCAKLTNAASRYRRVRRSCLGTVLVGLAMATYCATDFPLASTGLARSVIGHAAWFAVGIWAAARHISPVRDNFVPRFGPGDCFVLATLCLLVASSPLGGPLTFERSNPLQALVRESMFAAVAALTISAAVWGRSESSQIVRFLESKPMGWLGDRSYALFLWHLPILFAIMTLAGINLFSGSFVLISVATLAVSIAVADISWRFVESPILSWVHRRTQLRNQDTHHE